jgi:hypothetical protein
VFALTNSMTRKEIMERDEKIWGGLKNNMQNDYWCQVLPLKSDQIDLKLEHAIDSEDENSDSPSTVIETELRHLIPQGEVEILTTWFPKASKTLAWVLSKQRH